MKSMVVAAGSIYDPGQHFSKDTYEEDAILALWLQGRQMQFRYRRVYHGRVETLQTYSRC
jgi:hypothetical protein